MIKTQAVARLTATASIEVLQVLKDALSKVLGNAGFYMIPIKATSEGSLTRGIYEVVTEGSLEAASLRNAISKYLLARGFSARNPKSFFKMVGPKQVDLELFEESDKLTRVSIGILQPAVVTPVTEQVAKLNNLRRSMIANGCSPAWRVELKHPANILRQPSVAIGSWGWGANGDRKILQQDFSAEISMALKFLQRVYTFKEKKRNAAGGLFVFMQGDNVIRLSYDNKVPPSKSTRPTLDRQKKVPTYAEIYYAAPGDT